MLAAGGPSDTAHWRCHQSLNPGLLQDGLTANTGRGISSPVFETGEHRNSAGEFTHCAGAPNKGHSVTAGSTGGTIEKSTAGTCD